MTQSARSRERLSPVSHSSQTEEANTNKNERAGLRHGRRGREHCNDPDIVARITCRSIEAYLPWATDRDRVAGFETALAGIQLVHSSVRKEI